MASRSAHSRLTAFRRFAAGGAALALALSLAGVTAATPGGGASSARMVFMPTLGQSHGSHGHGPPIGGGKTNNLLYNGGPVETTPSVYLIYWGSQWKTGFSTGGYTSKQAQTYLNDFFGNVGGTSWDNINSQYCQGTTTNPCPSSGPGNIQNVSGQLAGIVTDYAASAPSKPTQSQIAAEAVWATTQAGIGYHANATYIVLTPSKHSMSGFAHQWCAWHSATSSTSGTVAYAYLPYQPDAGQSCGMNWVYPTNTSYGNGYFDGFSVVGGHEYAEALTDPHPSSGWVDSQGAETGDKCAWYYGTGKVTVGSLQWGVQPLWSNAANSGKGGCVTSF